MPETAAPNAAVAAAETLSQHRALAFYAKGVEPQQLLLCQSLDVEHGRPQLIVNTDPEGRSGPFADGYTCEAYDLYEMAEVLARHAAEGLKFKCHGGRVCGRVVKIDVAGLTVEIVPEPDLDVRPWTV